MKKKFIIDTALNIIATAIPIIVLQLFVLPQIATRVGSQKYGLIITLISLLTLFSHSFGNVLNNIRLLVNSKYAERSIEGDFNFLLIISIILNSIIMLLGILYFGISSSIDIILFIFASSLNLMRGYLIVAFRLDLNYKKIFISNFILGIGYLFGYWLFKLYDYWQLVYIIGLIISNIYIIINSDLIKESFSRTEYIKETSTKSIILLVSVILANALIYADKLILYPLLGAEAVSIYYSATILGKIISMGIAPVSSVMLSYLVKIDRISSKNFLKLLLSVTAFGFIGYLVSIYISGPLLNKLYPAWANESLDLIYITSASAIIIMIVSILNPIVIRFNNIAWQFIISLSNFTIYIGSTFLFYKLYGLYGYALGILLANVFNLTIILIIFIVSNRTKSEKCAELGQ